MKYLKTINGYKDAFELLEFAEILAEGFKGFNKLDKLASKDEQCLYTAAFIHGVFDDLVTSTKLFTSGKMIASGNLMRQAIEGLALATLCSYRGLLLIPQKSKNPNITTSIKYWDHVKNGDDRVNSNYAVSHLQLNRGTLRVSAEILDEMKRARKMYHPFSHPSILSLLLRMAESEGKYLHFVGGAFDKDIIDIYKTEIIRKAGFCTILPSAIDLLAKHLDS
jgi:hypothetical protein